MTLKCILFDFGGCLDSDGVHSRTLFLNEFKFKDKALFQDAYTFADQKVISESLILNSNLLEMNVIMSQLIAQKLEIPFDASVPQRISDVQSFHLKRNASVLSTLSKQYKLGIVSNFSGNLKIILEEFKLRQYFDFVIDSYYEQCAKPDIRIFKRALELAATSPLDCAFVGDNPERDIAPAKSLGMKTILITQNILSIKEQIADVAIEQLDDILSALKKIS